MSELVERKESNIGAVIALRGHIDSGNAPAVERELIKLREEHSEDVAVIDAEELEYISSAGLRVLLRLRKQSAELKIVNVSPDVYEVLDMTGFTEMMTVEKAYRRVSVEGCEAIGQGANGKVYRIDPETIIKVYNNPDSLPDIRRERGLARAAFVLGIPTAIPYDVVKVGDGYGSVFELLNAKSLSRLIAAEPEKLGEYVAMYVELLKRIHGTHVKPGEMPDMKAVAVGWAGFLGDYLPKNEADKLLKLVRAVPERDTMIHGDYHTKNVMMQNGEVLLIDMDTLSTGHPVFELASMFLGLAGFGSLDHTETERFLGIPYERAYEFWQKALRGYLGTDDEKRIKEVEDKARLVGYTRLMRRTIRRCGLDNEAGKKLIDFCKTQITKLLESVDTLDF